MPAKLTVCNFDLRVCKSWNFMNCISTTRLISGKHHGQRNLFHEMTPKIHESLDLYRTLSKQFDAAGDSVRAASTYTNFLCCRLTIAVACCNVDEGIASLAD